MKTIVVASTNPVKINATLVGFQKMFPEETFEISGVAVSSGVAGQPSSDEETLQGAINRMNNALRETPDADFCVGLEGGIEDTPSGMNALVWIAIRSQDGMIGKGKAGTYFLPNAVATLIREGKELGEADDIVFNRTNSKQSNGSIGLLTHDVIDREMHYANAVILALIPFKNEGLYE